MKLMQKHLYKALQEHKHIVNFYRKKYSKDNKRDWRTYEQRLALRIQKATRELEPIVKEAYSIIKVSKSKRGRPEKVPITKKVIVLLLKDIFQLSNRKMANMLAMFTALTGIELSYKSVERVYSNEIARMIIHNMFMLLVKKKRIKNPDVSGDGTGYALTVTKHYRNEREKELRKKSVKKTKAKKRPFVHVFALMDLDSGMYIGYGTSLKSEHEAFRKAKKMAEEMGISINTVRLDKLYSYQSITEEFGKETTIYIIPKDNATIKGPPEWKRIIKSFVFEHIFHLEEYFRRNNSESGFSADKRMSGWKIWQIRGDRINTALMCKGVWHNLMRLY